MPGSCSCQRGSSIRSPQPEWSRVSRVTRLQLRLFVTTVVLMLSRAWSGVRAARREAAERAVARASPAQPSSPASPAQPSTTPGPGAGDLDAGGGGGGHGGAAPVTLLCRGGHRCSASYPLIIAFTLVACRYTRYRYIFNSRYFDTEIVELSCDRMFL